VSGGLTAAALRQVWLVMEEPRDVRRWSGRIFAGFAWLGSSGRSGGDRERVVCGVPGLVFVVAGVVVQAAVEDADEPVRDGPEGLVVGGAAASLPVVERTGAG
jgi:hypothetical protein